MPGKTLSGITKQARRETMNTMIGGEVTVDVQYEGLPRHIRMVGVLQSTKVGSIDRYNLRGSVVDLPIESAHLIDSNRKYIELRFDQNLLVPERLRYWQNLVSSKQSVPEAQRQWRVA